MKFYLISTLLIINCNGVKLNLEDKYNSIVDELDSKSKEVVLEINDEWLETEGNGAAIFTIANKVNIESESESKNIEASENIWLASSQLESKILEIDIGQIFGNQSIKIRVEKGKIKTEFEEFYKQEENIKLWESDHPKSEMKIPLNTIQINLSKLNNFEIGEVIYGECKLMTKPYYLKYRSQNFTKIEREYEVYFKFKVRQGYRVGK